MATMQLEQKDPVKIVARVRKCFNYGITKSLHQRVKHLKNFKRFVEENEDAIVKAICEDIRKHKEEARLEIYVAINHIKYLLDNVKSWTGPERRSKRWVDLLDGLYVYNDPYGVVLVMCAWNVPLLTLIPVAGAIAAGNCVVIKPSHNSPNFGAMLSTILPKYLDSACFPVVLGDIAETTRLLEQKFDYIYYTGSTTVGKIVHQAANKYLTPVTLELGGKNPVYIDSSVDLESTAKKIIWAKCFNSGQICIAPDYILCSKSVEKRFIYFAKSAVEKFYSSDPKTCPIINDFHFKRLKNLLDGLNVALGGGTEAFDNYIEPTIVTDVPPDHPIMQEEIFGPILPILTVEDHRQAVDFINRKEKPLSLYIFTKNSSVRDYIIANTSSGGVTVNDTLVQLIIESLPFGGVGLSGMGRYKGKDSFDTFVHKKSVLIKNTWQVVEKINEIRYPPYSSHKTDVMNFLLKYRKGPSWVWIGYLTIFLLGFIIGFLFVYFFLIQN